MNIRDGLYHAETGIPWELFRDMTVPRGLEYGQHARRAALDDRYGQLTSVPLSHAFKKSEIFELKVEQGRIVKFAARLTEGFSVKTSNIHRAEISMLRDLVLVCTPSLRDSNNLFVKTLWLCERNDNHQTLNRSRYTPYAP